MSTTQSLNPRFFIEYYVPDYNRQVPGFRQFSLDGYVKLEIAFHIKVGDSIFKHQVSIVVNEDGVAEEGPIARMSVNRRPASFGDNSDGGETPELQAEEPATLVTIHGTHLCECSEEEYSEGESSSNSDSEGLGSTVVVSKYDMSSGSPDRCTCTEHSIPASESNISAGNSPEHISRPNSSHSFVPSSTRTSSPSSRNSSRDRLVESNPNESSSHLTKTPCCHPTGFSARIQETGSPQESTVYINRTNSTSSPSPRVNEYNRQVHCCSE